MSYADAARVLATDPATTEAGTFLPAGGDPVPCRLRFTRPDPIIDLGLTRARNRGYRLVVFTDGLPATPTIEDRIVARGTTYRIRDVEREVQDYWVTLDVSPG